MVHPSRRPMYAYPLIFPDVLLHLVQRSRSQARVMLKV
jgi:hypothetical protein